MVRVISFRKAIIAGMAGAVAWEVVLRALMLTGVPHYDVVALLGQLVAPGATAWIWWPFGLALHLAIGVVWAVFYAYFFWGLIRASPVLQGLVFSLLPAALTALVMHPQLELMRPAVGGEQQHYAGLFGLSAGWPEPVGLVVGHLIFGLVLGALYTRPVGYLARARVKPTDRLPAARDPARSPPLPPAATSEFMFATGIECSYPTIDGGRWRMDEMEMTGHYRRWRTDLQLVRRLGLRYLRYGPPLHLIFEAPDRFDWSFMDQVAGEMQRLEIIPIIDLCHFGLPNWLENFQNPAVPEQLAAYAAAFARRYPWVRLYTPVNEMYVCARFSALDGIWNEQLRSERAFVTAVRHLAKANILMMQAIRRERADAVFVNSESSEFYQACRPEPELQRIADFENQRRFLPLDLVYAHPLRPDIRDYVLANGMPADEYDWFMRQDVSREAVLGVDYYEWNEKVINNSGCVESLGELFGWYVIASQYYDRYQRPVMHTETNRLDARDGPRWLLRQWHNVDLFRSSGVPVIGFTWYSLIDQVDWDIGLGHPRGNVNPVGLFDLNRDPRPVALSYRHLVRSYAQESRAEGVTADAPAATSPNEQRGSDALS